MSGDWVSTAEASGSWANTAGRGDKIRCHIDGVWESRNRFSNAQLKKWNDAKQRRTVAHVTCLKHSTGSIQELRCDTCGQVKDINLFSKASRKTSGRHDCRDCVDWTEADQAGVRPLPMPGGQCDESEWDLGKAAHEEREILTKFDDMRIGESTATEGRSVCMDDETVKGVGGNLSHGLTTKNLNKFLKATQGPASSDGGLGTAQYHSSSAPSENLSAIGATPANARPTDRNQQRRVQYQAIGPNGTVQTRFQSTINPSDTASFTTTTNQTTTKRGGFAKVPGRKTNPDPPNYILREGPETQIEQAYDSDLSDDFA